MNNITVFIFVSTNKFITVEVFFWLFTISTRFQYLTFFSNPDSSHFLNRLIHVCGVTVFVLVSTNEFITVKVFFRMFTISTRFQYLTFFSNPDSSYFLNRFFYWFVHVSSVTVFILVGTNEFITVKVFFWFFTISTRFQDLTFFSNPDSSYFLNRLVHVRGVTVFILVGTNEFVTVKVFLRFFTIGTWFQDFTSYSNPNRSYLLNWFLYRFFYRFVDMGCDRPFNLSFHKLITREVILRFEIRSNHW